MREFIDGYMARSGIVEYQVAGDRVYYEGFESRVTSCRCGEEDCEGWQMIPLGSAPALPLPRQTG